MSRSLYFTASNSAFGNELYRLDASGSTIFVGDIRAGSSGISIQSWSQTFDGKRYFSADDGSHGIELWGVNKKGRAELVQDVNPGSGSSYATAFLRFGDKLLFSGNASGAGVELLGLNYNGSISSGYSSETAPGGSMFIGATVYNGAVYAMTGLSSTNLGLELYKFDGATDRLRLDINSGADHSYPGGFTVFNGNLYFAADDGLYGREIWMATSGGVVGRLTDIAPGSANANPSEFTQFNGSLYFRAESAGGDSELWALSAAGVATRVSDIWMSDNGSNPHGFTVFNGGLYFAANDGGFGVEVWRHVPNGDGTAELVSDINADAGSSDPSSFFEYNGSLYFAATSNTVGREVWKIDGSGTVSLAYDILPGGASSSPTSFSVSNNQLYVTAQDASGKDQLWKLTDGGSAQQITNIAFNDLTDVKTLGVFGETERSDLNGDGRGDILWRNDSGALAVWTMGGSGGTTIGSGNGIASQPDSSWKIEGTGDFNGDGTKDIFWRKNTGDLAIWTMGGANGTTVLSGDGIASQPLPVWTVGSIGDFNGDGADDILWFNPTTYEHAIWSMGGATGTTILDSGYARYDGWIPRAAGDFNGDGRTDTIWQNGETREFGIFHHGGSNGESFPRGRSYTLPDLPAGWTIAGTGDFDNEGHDDLLLRHTNGQVTVWTLKVVDHVTMIDKITGVNGSRDTSWTLEKTSDYNGDGNADILWRKDDGQMDVWTMGGSTGAVIVNNTTIASRPDGAWHVN